MYRLTGQVLVGKGCHATDTGLQVLDAMQHKRMLWRALVVLVLGNEYGHFSQYLHGKILYVSVWSLLVTSPVG